MVGLSSTQLFVIVVALVLTVVVAAIFLYLSSRLRSRRNQILGELQSRPELVQDRAFNRLEMARREAAVLRRSGTDIERAQDLIAQSQSAFDLRQYPRAYELAQSAHEALVNARGRAGVPSSNPVSATGGARPNSAGGPAPVASVISPPPPLAKNRSESHFQISLLESDVQGAQRAQPNAGTTVEADSLRMQAQAAFDRTDYSEALRIALRGRRLLGKAETLAPSGRAPTASTSGAPDDVAGVAERVAGSERCPECGFPTLPGDGFCRGCGIARTPTKCSACGAPRGPTDTFCGKCGAKFSA